MDKKKFQLKMKNFFEKAGVTLLQKGENYVGGEETSSYILLDAKRKSFYLTETDAFDKDDTELNGIAEYFIANYDIPEIPAKTILRLGRAGVFFDDDFTVDGVDFTPMIRKSAFVVSEANAEGVTEFLKKRSVNFQAVPFKGEFLVMFLDRSNSKKIATLYRKITDEFLKTSSGIPEPVDKEVLRLEDEIDRTIRENKILFDIDGSDDLVFNHKYLQRTATGEDASAGLSDEISVSLNSHSKSLEDSSQKSTQPLSANEKNAMNLIARGYKVPDNLPMNDEDKILTNNNLTPYFDEEKTLATKPAGKLNESILSRKEEKPGDAPLKDEFFYKIFANILAIIFFFPIYAINKITFKKVFPFVIYWIGAIIVFFGFYQMILSPIGNLFYDTVLEGAKTTANYASGLLSVTKDAASVEEAAGNVMNTALVYFTGEIAIWDWARNGLILKYLLTIGVFLMIFPSSRKLGALLSVFFILFYMLLPLAIFIQTEIIKGSVDGSLGIVKLAVTSGKNGYIFGAVSSCVAFAVYIIPLIFITVLYVASGFISPYKKENNNYEVLP